MRAVVQRVSGAELIVVEGAQEAPTERTHASIGRGLVVLAGIEAADTEDDLAWLVRKVVGLRVFEDDEGRMNRSLADLASESQPADAPPQGVLLVPNFTVAGRARKGRRPDFTTAKQPDQASPMFDRLFALLDERVRTDAPGCTAVRGVFGASMRVRLTNEGPVTIWLDSNE